MKIRMLINRNLTHFGWLVFFCLFFFSCTETERFPDELIGKWVTDAPLYEDRSITITETELTFGIGGLESNLFFIKSFKSATQENSVLWVFNCQISHGEFFDISLIYHPEEEYEKLQMKNAPHLRWYRAEE